jgi:5-methylcytosine-specific restriction protein B
MSARPVQSVFFWRADMKSAFKAAYGRKPNDTTYTKDFHQPRSDQARALERAFGIDEGGDVAVTWKWPGGQYSAGRFRPAADFDPESGGRMNLRWETDNAPPPWRLSEHPTSRTLETLEGKPDLTTAAEANAQLEAIQASGERPWFVAVHLRGDGPTLHARLALESPKPGREFASWDYLPASVREAMARLPENKTGGYVEFEESVPMRATKIVERIMKALRDNPNVLLVGPPGTGKTVALEDVAALFEDGGEEVTFDPDLLHGAFGETDWQSAGQRRTRSVVFHPSYSYEDFVVGLLPEPVEGGGGVTVKPHVGPLLELAEYAHHTDRQALLVCDEFNRGAAAAIFGDALALLDKGKRADPGDPASGAEIATPYFHLHPKANGNALSATTSFPSSLFILGAMNSADRSVAPLDAALRRRFSILFIEPDLDVLKEHFGLSPDFELGPSDGWTTADHVKGLAVEVLRALNVRIEAVLGRDFLLGQSVFWDVGGSTSAEAWDSLAAAIDNQVMGTLALAFADNDAALAAVLKVDPSGEAGSSELAAAHWTEPDDSIRQVAAPRLRLTTFQALEHDKRKLAIQSLL